MIPMMMLIWVVLSEVLVNSRNKSDENKRNYNYCNKKKKRY